MNMNRENFNYSDWFGEGNLVDDIKDVVEEFGQPNQIFYEGTMASLVYDDKVIVTGYDGNEYVHTFIMRNKA